MTINGSLNLVTNASTHSGGGLKLGVYRTTSPDVNLSNISPLPGIVIIDSDGGATGLSNGNPDNNRVNVYFPRPSAQLEGTIIFIHQKYTGHTIRDCMILNSNNTMDTSRNFFEGGDGDSYSHMRDEPDFVDNGVFYICLYDPREGIYIWKEYWCGPE